MTDRFDSLAAFAESGEAFFPFLERMVREGPAKRAMIDACMKTTKLGEPESPRVVWERALSCMESFDVEGYADCFAIDGVQCFPFAPSFMPSRLVGRNQIRQQLSAYRAKSKDSGRRTVAIVTTAVHEIADSESLIAEFEVHGIERGVAFVIPYVHVVRVKNGEIVSLRDYFDSLALADRIRQSHGSS